MSLRIKITGFRSFTNYEALSCISIESAKYLRTKTELMKTQKMRIKAAPQTNISRTESARHRHSRFAWFLLVSVEKPSPARVLSIFSDRDQRSTLFNNIILVFSHLTILHGSHVFTVDNEKMDRTFTKIAKLFMWIFETGERLTDTHADL
jgi:hypothetical protein